MSRHLSSILVLALSGCWSSADVARAPEITFLDAHPLEEVAVDAAIELRFSAPLDPPSGRWPLVVTRADGRSVPCVPALADDGVTLVLWPVPEWPSDDRLFIHLHDGLRGAQGQLVGVDEARPIAVATTAREPSASSFALESPEPGTKAPPNLRSLVLTLGGELSIEHITLTSPRHRVEVPIVQRDGRGRVLAELPSGAPMLDPDAAYEISVHPSREAASLLQGRVYTSSVPDTLAPEVRLRDLDRGGGGVRVVIEADEPILARGLATNAGAGSWELRGSLTPRTRVELRTSTPLPPGAAFTIRIDAADDAGNVAPTLEVGIVTPPEVAVRLSEVVATPLHDWSDATAGVPLDGTPGRGAVSDADEWIELINVSDVQIDLTQVALGLRVLDGSPVEHDLSAAAQLYFGRAGDVRAWGVGEALVVRPRGTMAQRDVIIEVVWGDRILDRMSFGRDPGDDHVGGAPPDLEHEAIARQGGVWRWCEPTPGDPQLGACVR